MWTMYDSLRCPTLLLRGADSDLLKPETAQAMTQRGPKAELKLKPHAPELARHPFTDILQSTTQSVGCRNANI